MSITRPAIAAAGSGPAWTRPTIFALTRAEATANIDHQIEVIRSCWNNAADAARLTLEECQRPWGRQILDQYSFQDY